MVGKKNSLTPLHCSLCQRFRFFKIRNESHLALRPVKRVGVSWFQHTLACQTIVFVTYLSSYLSAWMVVMVTIENYIHVRHSQRAKTLCTPFKAKMISLGFILLGLACYHFSFWTTTSEASGNRHVCTTKLEYFALHEIFTYVDTTLTLALPSLLLFVFTTGIVCCLLVLVKGSECRESCKRGPTGTFQISPLTQITVMLLAVTFSFILFHTPSHVVRLWMICEAFLTTDPNQLLPALRLQRVFEILYYTNFATNFLTFFFTGRQYRRVLKLRLMRFLCRKSSVTSAAYL
ncbi:mu-type opioid receptor [Biomphalaria glabrata]|nr:mu-type opioid receptor [Biomphalaria glabrata]